MILTYDFDNEDYEYEINYSVLRDYLMDLPIDDKFYIAERIYEQRILKEKNQDELDRANEWGVHSIDDLVLDNPAAIEYVNDVITDIEDYELKEIWGEQLEDYFYSDALECYQDAKLFNSDPYGYYGLKQSDFY